MRLKRTLRHRAQRERLFQEQGGRCYWCNGPMVLPPYPAVRGRRQLGNEATIEHLDSRYSPERGQHNGILRHVVACYDCNGKRNRLEQQLVPREVLWRAAGAYPQHMRVDALGADQDA